VILAVPALAPKTKPDVNPTLALVVALLLHVPPGAELPSNVEVPTHTDNIPVLASGIGFTVTSTVREQPKLLV
jgi:hypothetical protein